MTSIVLSWGGDIRGHTGADTVCEHVYNLRHRSSSIMLTHITNMMSCHLQVKKRCMTLHDTVCLPNKFSQKVLD